MHHMRVRNECVDFLIQNEETFSNFVDEDLPFSTYVEQMRYKHIDTLTERNDGRERNKERKRYPLY